MKIAIGSDHAGFALKERLRESLAGKGHQVTDFGTSGPESTDYPDYAALVGRAVAAGDADRGILVCSTGVGMSIAANKIDGVRAALAFNVEEVGLARSHNDANVLALSARYSDEAAANEMLEAFLGTEFGGGRHARRVAKLMAFENVETGQVKKKGV